MDKAMAARIGAAGFDYVGVSVARFPANHDRIRGHNATMHIAYKGKYFQNYPLPLFMPNLY